jgi:hypothetical protein
LAKTAKLMVFKFVTAATKTWRSLTGEISCRTQKCHCQVTYVGRTDTLANVTAITPATATAYSLEGPKALLDIL